jgi:hypothetical protein
VRKPWIWILLLVAGLYLPKIYLLLKFRSVLIESDEAVVGLMARHILHGEFPIFYYGQNYMGTTEAFVTALLFIPLGATSLALKLVPLLIFSIFLVVHYHLARLVSDQRVAVFATTLVGISPAFLSIWSMKSRGGYMALLLFGTSSLLIAAKILREGYTHRSAVLLGLCMGLAWWTHFLAIVYIVPIFVILLLKNEKQLLSRFGALIIGSFLLGSFPFWIYNIIHSWSSLELAASKQTDFVSDFRSFFGTAVPIFFGVRRNWNRGDLFPLAGLLVLGIFISCCVVLVKRWFIGHPPGEMNGRHLLLSFTLMFPVLFSASGFAWFVDEPRYLISLYSTIYILLLLAWRTAKARGILILFFLLVNLVGTLVVRVEDFNGYNNLESDDNLITFLNDHHVRAAYAPYWVAYRVTFETGEKIICSPPEDDFVRYRPFLDAVKSVPSAAFIRLVAPRYQGPHSEIRPPQQFIPHRVGNYEVFLPPTIN